MDNKSRLSKTFFLIFVVFMVLATVLVFTSIPHKELIIMIIATVSVISCIISKSLRPKNSSAVKRTFNILHIVFVLFVVVFMFFIIITRLY